MDDFRGIIKPELHALPQMQARITFLYLERCKLNREANAITIWDKEGVTHVPAAALTAILLGPGTNITPQEVELVAESGVTLIWVGKQGVRYYAFGRLFPACAGVIPTRPNGRMTTRLFPACGGDPDQIYDYVINDGFSSHTRG